jgi:hypothetical protein
VIEQAAGQDAAHPSACAWCLFPPGWSCVDGRAREGICPLWSGQPFHALPPVPGCAFSVQCDSLQGGSVSATTLNCSNPLSSNSQNCATTELDGRIQNLFYHRVYLIFCLISIITLW